MTQVREDDSGEPLKRGTRVTLHLKEDAYELADEKKLQDLIKQYSEFIQFPIRYDGISLCWCSFLLDFGGPFSLHRPPLKLHSLFPHLMIINNDMHCKSPII